MAGRPIPYPGVHGPDDLAGQRRIADQRRPAAARRDVLGRAAHVDVPPVEAQRADHLRHLVELVRIGAVDLGHDRPSSTRWRRWSARWASTGWTSTWAARPRTSR